MGGSAISAGVHGAVCGEFLVSVRFLRVVVYVGGGQSAKRGVIWILVTLRVDAMWPALFGEDDRIQFLPPPHQFLIQFLLHPLHLQAQHIHLLVPPPLVLQQPIQPVDLPPKQLILLRAIGALGTGESRFGEGDLAVVGVYHQTFLVDAHQGK